MVKTITLFIFLSFAGGISCQQPTKENPVIEQILPQSTATDKGFDIDFKIEKIADDLYHFSTLLELEDGNFVISPYSNDFIYGHFSIDVAKNEHLIPEGVLLETPPSVEEMDTIISSFVRFVRVNTTYQQPLKLVSEEDFEVTGLIEFVLEPICIPYDVEFTIAHKNGKLNITKTKTSISSEYRRK